MKSEKHEKSPAIPSLSPLTSLFSPQVAGFPSNLVSRVALLEACVETVDEARAAERGGAARLELCARLDEQGTTPEEDTITACLAAVAIPVFVMVRPRAGPFVYASDEVARMCRQARRARSLEVSGIVTGAMTADGLIDRDAMAAIVEAAAPLPVTCHRAFDAVCDREAALETLVRLGVSRILTSGGAPTAEAGMGQIARMVRHAAGRLVVIAGGGVRAHNVRRVVAGSGVSEVHAHLTSTDDVRALVANLREIDGGRR